jgi:hypothetical protein
MCLGSGRRICLPHRDTGASLMSWIAREVVSVAVVNAMLLLLSLFSLPSYSLGFYVVNPPILMLWTMILYTYSTTKSPKPCLTSIIPCPPLGLDLRSIARKMWKQQKREKTEGYNYACANKDTEAEEKTNRLEWVRMPGTGRVIVRMDGRGRGQVRARQGKRVFRPR